MARVELDPAEIRAFRNALMDLGSRTRSRRFELESGVQEARSFWDDGRYKDFRALHESLMLEVQEFERFCEKFCDFLRRKADAADAFLDG